MAEAEEEAARAEARAEAARARLMQLRNSERPAAQPARSRLRRLRLPRRKTVAVGVAIVLGCASLGASGYLVWQHHALMHKRQLAPEFAAAARQGVTAFMSIDANHAREDIGRIIDLSTGLLKTQVEASSSFMVQQAEESKVSSKATVEAVAVESVTDNSAVVLVAAKSDVTNADNTKRPPAVWRLTVNIERDDGQLKMSKVDFLQ